jgi:threonine synthase
MMIHCSNCHAPYPTQGVPYCCPECGGVYDYDAFPACDLTAVENDLPGIWRYRHALGLPGDAPVVSLGEGGTPLVWNQYGGQEVAFKLEYQNPTGSFKDRGEAPLVSFLCARGVTEAVEDSSGNAGASFAAYAARSGMKAHVFIPEYASGPKREQIVAFGANVVVVPGPRSNAATAVRLAAKRGMVYASHAYLPFVLPGMATIAYELIEQLGGAPGSIVAPVGQGSLLLGVGRGFQALQRSGEIDRLPMLIGVQARACAPLWAVFNFGPSGLGWVTEGETLAEGVRIYHPLRGDAVLALVEESEGAILAVDEEDILPARDALAHLGLYVETTSAIVWAALMDVIASLSTPIVVLLTGWGYKTP